MPTWHSLLQLSLFFCETVHETSQSDLSTINQTFSTSLDPRLRLSSVAATFPLLSTVLVLFSSPFYFPPHNSSLKAFTPDDMSDPCFFLLLRVSTKLLVSPILSSTSSFLNFSVHFIAMHP